MARGSGSPTRRRGDGGEAIAAAYVEGQLGWRIVGRNVLYRVGELDIVAEDGDQLVFIEVRSRGGRSGPRAEDTVTYPKQRRLTRAALMFMSGYGGRCGSGRFDVIAVDLDRGVVRAHYRCAFEARGG